MKTQGSLLLMLFFLFSTHLFGGDVQFSSNTKALVQHLKSQKDLKSISTPLLSSLKTTYPIRNINGQYMIGALMIATPEIDTKMLKELGVQVNTKINAIWSVLIPLSSLEKMSEVAGLKYLEVDASLSLKLDNATLESRVKDVHSGTGLPRKCYGDSVVVGIVDEGFDYTHPTFYDTSGTTLRILRSWEQNNTTGPPPSGFSYGTEFVGSDALLQQKSSAPESHGSHVAGIASGSGFLSPGRQYMGVAPASNLIFVNTGEAGSSVIDGINYTFQQAAALSRPAVVNLSLGSHIGPHDGTSVLDQAIDGIVGPGRIVVGAAGNEGSTPLHLYKAFSSDTIRTFMDFENKDPDFNTGQVDQWGSAGSDFTVALMFSDGNGDPVYTTAFYPASSNPNINETYMAGEDSLNYSITGVSSNPTNNKPNILVGISRLSKSYLVTLMVTSSNSQVNLWNHGLGDGASLYDTLNGTTVPGYTAGDVNSTMGEIGGTSNKIITVGAYVTKDSYVNIKGNTMKSDDPLNTLASFSSRGPTADGRTKPEITAPGEKIVSSVNSYDTSYNENNDEVIIRVEQGGSGWFFAAMQGTSMATPMTTGIVALMLQANPALGPEQAKQILKQNARTDSYTGTIPPEGSNSWGWGKIDAQKSVLAAFNAQGIGENRTPDLTVYPNPSTGIIHLKTTGSFRKFSSVSVMNLQGVTVYQSPENPGWKDQEAIDLSFLPSGVYMLNIQFSDGQPFHSKIAIVR